MLLGSLTGMINNLMESLNSSSPPSSSSTSLSTLFLVTIYANINFLLGRAWYKFQQMITREKSSFGVAAERIVTGLATVGE